MLQRSCTISEHFLGKMVGVEGVSVRSDNRSACRITVYTKPDCELCAEAKAALLALREEFAFDVEEIDITADPVLGEAFREEIPVGFLDGQKLFKYHVDPALMRRQLLRRGGRSGLTRWMGRRS